MQIQSVSSKKSLAFVYCSIHCFSGSCGRRVGVVGLVIAQARIRRNSRAAMFGFRSRLGNAESSKMILLTGGAGYIGSHICMVLLNAGLDVVAVDNLSNCNKASLERIESICGRTVTFWHVDIRNEEAIYEILRACGVTAVIHLAGLKAVAESNLQPMTYYEINVLGTMRLVSAMRRANVKTLVFSSSATVYGIPTYLPLDEKHPLRPTNPYGRTKVFIEEMLKDLYQSERDWRIAILRYFNPVGAHESGLIGEDPTGVPSNLLPFVAQVAIRKREKLVIYGNDYGTPDGTGIRDFIHVVDLASGHLTALIYLKQPGVLTVNLGTGTCASVLEVGSDI
jgi:UDP-glucose 4-epimerase